MSHFSLSPCTGSWLQLASSSRHWCLHIKQPQAQQPPTSTHFWQSTSPPDSWDLWVSDASWCHHREAKNHFPERFHSPFLAGGMNLPPSSGMLNPWQFQATPENSSLMILLLHKKRTLNSPCLASFALKNAWNVVWQALPVIVCLFITYRLLYSSIVSCKWIKASAKLINVLLFL